MAPKENRPNDLIISSLLREYKIWSAYETFQILLFCEVLYLIRKLLEKKDGRYNLQ